MWSAYAYMKCMCACQCIQCVCVSVCTCECACQRLFAHMLGARSLFDTHRKVDTNCGIDSMAVNCTNLGVRNLSFLARDAGRCLFKRRTASTLSRERFRRQSDIELLPEVVQTRRFIKRVKMGAYAPPKVCANRAFSTNVATSSRG